MSSHLNIKLYPIWGLVNIEGEKLWRHSAVSTGTRPHYDGKKEILEVYIFNYSGNLYQKRIKVSFVDKIRNEEKFNSEQELINKMKEDCSKIKNILKNTKSLTAQYLNKKKEIKIPDHRR